MKDSEYGSSNVLIRVYENDLLDRGHYNRMLAAPSFEDAVNILRETPYRNDVEQIKENKNYDDMFMNELHQTFEKLFFSVPNKSLIELAGLRYAYHNLKVLFKEEYTDQKLDHLFIPIGRYDISYLRQAVRTGESEELPEHYLESIHEVQEDYNEYQNAESIDIILDRRYFTHLRKLSEEVDNTEVIDLIETQVDHNNLSTLTRGIKQGRTPNFLTTVLSSSGSLAKEELVSVGENDLREGTRILREGKYRPIIEASIDNETGELSPVKIEYEMDNAYMRKMQEAKLKAFGPLPILAFIYAKETEIKNLRLVLSGKENGVAEDNIRERMRLNYGS